ncbi:MAG: ABC transporter substrate-binding protein [Acidimicrobiales bacterium]
MTAHPILIDSIDNLGKKAMTRSGSRSRRTPVLLLLLALFGLMAAACGDDDTAEASGDTTEAPSDPVTVRLGYFPNVTHAPGIVGDLGGLFEESSGDNVTIETSTFNAGPEAVEALFAEALDITLIGPNPAINAFAQSDGTAVRIVSGSTSGGAFLVVREGIDSPEDLVGKSLATPQLGNTQDVALRAWLKDQGYETDDAGGGDVSIQPQANGDALAAFIAGDIDGAWVPEPFATRFIQEGGAHVLVDERDLWPDGRYVTTHLIVRTAFLEDHPDVVKGIIEGLAAAIDLIESDPEEAKSLTNQGIEAVTDKPLGTEVLDAAWENLAFTLDPIATSLSKSAQDAVDVGLLEPVELDDIYDLTLLNEVLTDRGDDEVEGL